MVTLVVATGLFLFLFRDGWELADQKSSVLGMAFGAAGLLLALSQWWRGRSAPPVPDLAEVVRAQWRQEERLRGVHDPYPLPVRWTNAPAALVDHWPTIHRDPDRDEPVDLEGTLDHVAEVYAAVPSGRLVVLGRPGSGKSVFTTRFVLGVSSDRVPVIFSLASWDPAVDLRAWMADRLEREHGPEAGALVDEGRILPVLDGFDEIAAPLRDAALRGINAALGEGDPLVLTSRVDEYAAAADVVTGAAAIVLMDLDAADVEKYLRLSTRGDKWAPVLHRLLPVLGTPLMLTLARTVYDTADPAELLDVPDPEAHLLGKFVPALYGERDQRYFRFLAGTLARRDTYDLAWWELPAAVPRFTALFVAAACVPIVAAGLVLGQWATPVVLALFVGMQAGNADVNRAPVRPRPTRWRGAPLGVAVGACAGFLVGLVFDLTPIRFALVVVAFGALGAVFTLNDTPVGHLVSDPGRVLRLDRAASVATAVKWTAPVTVLYGLLDTALVAQGLALALGVCLTQTLVYQAWGRFGLARVHLAATGKLPWRLMAFLREAHRKGVLRQAGPVYQFRHARLRDRLAQEAD
ncbi:NACHT domain-containing protein [Umezawaea sp. NPDC059074]|uniref:NACHT domain-containing protein n=1 Tax=Umezawaea sp. NPDC059074 TaxID=3346716 RepID=UPI0036902E47